MENNQDCKGRSGLPKRVADLRERCSYGDAPHQRDPVPKSRQQDCKYRKFAYPAPNRGGSKWTFPNEAEHHWVGRAVETHPRYSCCANAEPDGQYGKTDERCTDSKLLGKAQDRCLCVLGKDDRKQHAPHREQSRAIANRFGQDGQNNKTVDRCEACHSATVKEKLPCIGWPSDAIPRQSKR